MQSSFLTLPLRWEMPVGKAHNWANMCLKVCQELWGNSCRVFGFPGVFVSAYVVTLEAHLSPHKAELVLGFASFSIHYPPCPGGLKWWFWLHCQSQGLVTTTQFFLKLFTYSVICFWFFLSICSLAPVSLKKTGTNNSSVLIAAEVGTLCLLATLVLGLTNAICSLRSSVFLLLWRFYIDELLRKRKEGHPKGFLVLLPVACAGSINITVIKWSPFSK